MPLPEDVVADDPRYADEHPSHHNQIHAAINDLSATAQGLVDVHALDQTSVHGISDTAQLPAKNTTNTFTLDQTFNTSVRIKGPEPWADVKAYGAVGNGTTDDTAAVQSAINSGAPTIYFPASRLLGNDGNYRITSSLTIPDHYLTFVGEGPERSRLVADSGVDIFTVATGRHSVYFKSLHFKGQATPAGSNAFSMPGTGPIGGTNYFGTEFQDCWFTNFTNVIELGSTDTELTGLTMTRCQFLNAPLRLINGGAKNTMRFWQCRWAGLTQNVPACEISNTAASTDVLIQFYSCTFESLVRQAVVLESSQDVLFESCYFEQFVDTTVPWVDLQGDTSAVTFRQCYWADPAATGQVMIGTSTATTTFYGVRLEGQVYASGTSNIERNVFPDLVEIYDGLTGISQFRHTVQFTKQANATRWEATADELRSYNVAEAQPRVLIDHDLTTGDQAGIAFGSGSAAPDTRWWRESANVMKTDDSVETGGLTATAFVLKAGGYFAAESSMQILVGAGDLLYLGADADTAQIQVRRGLRLLDAKDVQLGTATGTKIGTGTTQKLAFWNATPVVQPAANADTSGATLAALETEVNELKALLRSVGLMAP